MRFDFRQHFYSLLAAGLLFFSCLGLLRAAAGDGFELEKEVLSSAERMYGGEARSRLLAWQDLIRGSGGLSERGKMDKVNGFFNGFDFVSDESHWGVDDYWATPVEFIASGGGDCEDFALAKYFTLKAVGVSEDKLNLTYVKALGLNQAHMVLTFYPAPDAEPLVLDNLVDDILPASARTDLLPVYSFNGSGLWIAKQRGRGRQVGDSDRLRRWQELLGRMPNGLN
ncbi:MAG: transglutaminase-like cysteine peptidase [Desulfobulbaceae bacterium]|nr:transglutaminase-like cysteine peptidase [Desulfobulbaceae bacterium]